MATKYFVGIDSIEELKKAYKRLARKHHPDLGGDPEIMKEINAEYDCILDKLANGWKGAAKTASAGFGAVKDCFRQMIERIIALEGLEIEICGNWVWVSGDTYTHRKAIKEAGYRWASKKRMWYWRPEEFATSSHGKKTMEEIRDKYGSTGIKGAPQRKLSA